MAPYILAQTLKAAHAFAKDELGLGRGQYRVVNHPGSLKSVRSVDLHLVPGWEKRFDRFAMKNAIRYTRMNVITPEMREAASVPDDLEPAGEQLLIPVDSQEATDLILPLDATPVEIHSAEHGPESGRPQDFNDFFDNGDTMISEGGPVAPEPEPEVPAEKPKNRRRRRCKDCGELHFKEDSCQTVIEA